MQRPSSMHKVSLISIVDLVTEGIEGCLRANGRVRCHGRCRWMDRWMSCADGFERVTVSATHTKVERIQKNDLPTLDLDLYSRWLIPLTFFEVPPLRKKVATIQRPLFSQLSKTRPHSLSSCPQNWTQRTSWTLASKQFGPSHHQSLDMDMSCFGTTTSTRFGSKGKNQSLACLFS